MHDLRSSPECALQVRKEERVVQWILLVQSKRTSTYRAPRVRVRADGGHAAGQVS